MNHDFPAERLNGRSQQCSPTRHHIERMRVVSPISYGFASCLLLLIFLSSTVQAYEGDKLVSENGILKLVRQDSLFPMNQVTSANVGEYLIINFQQKGTGIDGNNIHQHKFELTDSNGKVVASKIEKIARGEVKSFSMITDKFDGEGLYTFTLRETVGISYKNGNLFALGESFKINVNVDNKEHAQQISEVAIRANQEQRSEELLKNNFFVYFMLGAVLISFILLFIPQKKVK